MAIEMGPVLRVKKGILYPLSQNDYRQEKTYFRIIFGGSTGKSCKSPGGYYMINFWGIIFRIL